MDDEETEEEPEKFLCLGFICGCYAREEDEEEEERENESRRRKILEEKNAENSFLSPISRLSPPLK